MSRDRVVPLSCVRVHAPYQPKFVLYTYQLKFVICAYQLLVVIAYHHLDTILGGPLLHEQVNTRL